MTKPNMAKNFATRVSYMKEFDLQKNRSRLTEILGIWKGTSKSPATDAAASFSKIGDEKAQCGVLDLWRFEIWQDKTFKDEIDAKERRLADAKRAMQEGKNNGADESAIKKFSDKEEMAKKSLCDSIEDAEAARKKIGREPASELVSPEQTIEALFYIAENRTAPIQMRELAVDFISDATRWHPTVATPTMKNVLNGFLVREDAWATRLTEKDEKSNPDAIVSTNYHKIYNKASALLARVEKTVETNASAKTVGQQLTETSATVRSSSAPIADATPKYTR